MFPPLELILWIGCLAGMALIDPTQPHVFSLCLFHHLGLPCPGCGLGRSIAWLFRGDLAASFWTHPLGIPAVLILGMRIVQLTRKWFGENKSAMFHIPPIPPCQGG